MAGKKRRSNQSDKNEEQSRPNKDNVEVEEGSRAAKKVPKSPMEELDSFIKSSMPSAEALKRIAGSKVRKKYGNDQHFSDGDLGFRCLMTLIWRMPFQILTTKPRTSCGLEYRSLRLRASWHF